MLVDPQLRQADPVLQEIGGGFPTTRLDEGLYEIGHFSFDMLLSKRGGNLHNEDDWDPYADLPTDRNYLGSYGVCDSPKQFMEDHGKALVESLDQFVISFTRIAKADQPAEGGWRWHKWGEYVGRLTPTTEYLHDEPEIEQVYCYHVFKRKVS